jgi:error-prone DNA polymerase
MFVHLHVHSPYSFLDGASEIETLVQRAAAFGMPALALTDHDTVAAAVKFTLLCEGYGIKPILGAEITLADETHLTLLAENREGYGSLCRLITASYAYGGRRSPRLPWSALDKMDTGGMLCLSGCRRGALWRAVHAHRYDDAIAVATRLKNHFSGRFYVELQCDVTPASERVANELASLADHLGVPAVATNNVHMATREDYIAWDILRAVATHTTTTQIHIDRPLNAQRYLKSAAEMAELFTWRPDAVANTLQVAERCEAALPRSNDLTPAYQALGEHADAAGYLRYLTYKGASARYGSLTSTVKGRIEHELDVILRLGYADYFLMAWRTALWSRRQGIRVTGRGSAADSCVAYCLRLTDVDVIRRDLPFARFLTEGKTPDIDLDFPSDRRDEVFRYLIDTYGSEHVANVCVFSTYRAKAAARDIGKALVLPADALSWLSDHLSHFTRPDRLLESFDTLPELKPWAPMREQFRLLFALCRRVANFPRHIGTHSSGVVISRLPLTAIAPVRPSARGLVRIWELDKDDAEAVGAIKLDVLSLRTLSAVSDAERSLATNAPGFAYDRIPDGDPETYRMIQAGEAVGAFQLESSAQLALAATLHPQNFEDLVASVALIRPSPVRGDAVQRFVLGRNGWIRPSVLHPALAPILAKTYGALVFQEQAILVIAAMLGCSEAEGDRFRKSLARHAHMGTMDTLRAAFVSRAMAHHADFDEVRAHLLFDTLEGWAGYGFTEGHAASFALTGYRTSYLVRHHPAEYFAGMLSHQPMGFYSANTLAAEARQRGVEVLPVDINKSEGKCSAPTVSSLRLGLQLVQGLREEDVEAIIAERSRSPFASLLDFCIRVPLHRDRLENLILCGAFDRLHAHRRGLLWRLEETVAMALSYRARAADSQELLALGTPEQAETPVAAGVAPFSPWEAYLWTWRITGVCAECHVFAYLREQLAAQGVTTTYDARRVPHGRRITVAGLNIRPHRPPTKSGQPVLFTSIEDEFGLLQAVCVGEAIESCTSTFLTSAAVLVTGVLERKGSGCMLRVEEAYPLQVQKLAGDDETSRAQVMIPAARTYPGTALRAEEAART